MVKKKRFYLKIYALLVLLGFAVIFTGCLPQSGTFTTNPIDKPQLPSAPLPTYSLGTRYVYSNGTWEEVTGIEGTLIQWTNQKGNSKRVYSDFTQRSIEWETTKHRGTRNIKPVVYPLSSQKTSLWPLETGNYVNYDESGLWQEKGNLLKKSKAFWRCSVKGTARIAVAAGEFDTWKILCTRFKNEEKSTGSSTREYKTYYYSPMVGHWVKLTQEYQSSLDKFDKSKELVAVLPNLETILDKKAGSQLQLTFQRAMENNKRGQTTIWKRKKDRLSVETIPHASFWKAENIPCRQYIQKITQAGDVQKYFGMACREKTGTWKIPLR